MTRPLVDTALLIDHLNGPPEARETIARLTQESDILYASLGTKIETLAGMKSSEEKATGPRRTSPPPTFSPQSW